MSSNLFLIRDTLRVLVKQKRLILAVFLPIYLCVSTFFAVIAHRQVLGVDTLWVIIALSLLLAPFPLIIWFRVSLDQMRIWPTIPEFFKILSRLLILWSLSALATLMWLGIHSTFISLFGFGLIGHVIALWVGSIVFAGFLWWAWFRFGFVFPAFALNAEGLKLSQSWENTSGLTRPLLYVVAAQVILAQLSRIIDGNVFTTDVTLNSWISLILAPLPYLLWLGALTVLYKRAELRTEEVS